MSLAKWMKKAGKKGYDALKDSDKANKAMKYATGNAIAAEKAASKTIAKNPKKAVAAALAAGYVAGEMDDEDDDKKKKKKRAYLDD